MRQLIQSYRSGEMKVEDVPPPVAQPGGVLVRTVRSLVSAGTEKMVVDLARKGLLGKARARPDLVRKVLTTARKQGMWNTLKKVQTKLDTPIPLGYSAAGVVVELGDEHTGFKVGDRVACAGAGYANHADYNYVPRNLAARIPDGVSMETASFATVGSIALQGVRQTDPTLGDRVAVLGLGLIGQITVQLLRANGCRVLGFDPDPERAALAERMGAHQAVSGDLEQAAERFSDGDGMDAVIVAASTPSAGPLEQAGEIARLRGRIVVVGLVGMELPRSLYYRKELDLRMSMSYGPGRYDADYEERGIDYPLPYVRWTEQRNLQAFLELAADGRLDLEALVTHRFSIADALDAYGLVTEGKEPFLGVVLGYEADDEEVLRPASRVELSREPVAGEKVGIGLVGAGSFGQSVLLPALKASALAEPVAIATGGGMTARRLGEQYGFRHATADASEVIADAAVDAVFVLTRHHLHASLASEALRAGKCVFTEKPLAMGPEELEALCKARLEAGGPDVMVGFNRRFAPLVAEIREHFDGRGEPLVMQYRVNAGFIPEDHWTQDPIEGGGRILGEGCHFLDLMHSLAGAPPVRVFAESIPGGGRFRADDNVVITTRFADGSVGTLLYTAMGEPRLAKESLEVYSEGKVALLDDFRALRLLGGGAEKKSRSANQDKGFDAEIQGFLEAVSRGDALPLPFDEAVATTRITFAALESLRSGEPQTL